MGKALLREGKVTDAIAALQEAARLEPSSGEAHYQLGLALSRAGRKEDAAAALKKGRELVAEEDKRQHAQLDLAEGRPPAHVADTDSRARPPRRRGSGASTPAFRASGVRPASTMRRASRSSRRTFAPASSRTSSRGWPPTSRSGRHRRGAGMRSATACSRSRRLASRSRRSRSRCSSTSATRKRTRFSAAT